jgi:hypothetical protein
MASALLTAASPLFLLQLVQPSAELPAAAAWTIAVACVTSARPRHVMWSGVAAAMAVLFVPPLFRMAAVIALFILFRPERTRSQRTQAALAYIGAAVAGYGAGAVVLAVFSGDYTAFQASTKGLESDFDGLLRWLTATDLAIAGLALLAPVILPGALSVLLLVLCAVNVIVYLPNLSVEPWSSLKGLLPGLPLVFVLGAAVIDAAWRRWISPGRKVLQTASCR